MRYLTIRGGKKIVIALAAMAMLAMSATASAVTVTFQGLNSVDPNVQSTFFVDVEITDVGPLSFYSAYDLTVELVPVVGNLGATFSSVANVTGQADYVFQGSSASFASSVLASDVATASDSTSVMGGVPAALDNPLVARFVIDVSGAAIGTQFAIGLCDTIRTECLNTNEWDGFDDMEIARIDNFVANDKIISVVPVPAAVWLFGSALGLLGWIRRRTA